MRKSDFRKKMDESTKDKIAEALIRAQVAEAVKQQRWNFVADTREAYVRGDISIDPDDPRTTRGFNKNELRIILGYEDDDYDDIKQNCDFYREKL